MKEQFDFYSKTVLKSYNLDDKMRYQLNMLDNLDVFTRKHCENVANLTCRICEYMHLNKEFTIYCTICAYLHDIGKLFIPPSILQKQAALTDEEFETMKTHTIIGYDMCMKDLKLRPYAVGARSHHEALNGTGYPDGLRKKDIPIEAQIIRVADEYDAIVSKRQYKSHIDISDTLEIIIGDSKPSAKSDALSKITIDSKVGKVNPKIVKVLLKVVIDDIEYEIACLYEYVEYLKSQVERLEQIDNYYNKMIVQKRDSKKQYFAEGIKVLLDKNETMENYKDILYEYQDALKTRQEKIEKLNSEIKKIKKLKVCQSNMDLACAEV